MPSTGLFFKGAKVRFGDGRLITTCLLELCPDRAGKDCFQNCPACATSEISRRIAEKPDTIIAQFLRKEIVDVGGRASA